MWNIDCQKKYLYLNIVLYDHIFHDTCDICKKFFIITFYNCFSFNFATFFLNSAFFILSSAFSNSNPVILIISLAISSLSKSNSDSITLVKQIIQDIYSIYAHYNVVSCKIQLQAQYLITKYACWSWIFY